MDTEHAVAIVGMSCRMPGAPDVAAFWRNVVRGVESISFFTDAELAMAGVPEELRRDPRYVPARGYLSDIDLFDAAFFGITPDDAAVLDPQHRIALECGWHAMEDAGYDVTRLDMPTGVFLSASPNTYLLNALLNNRELAGPDRAMQLLLGGSADFLATRVSYKLNLRGPSMNVQTACSSSLVAVHVALQALLNHECDIALAGGVSVDVPAISGYLYRDGGIASPDGCCRPFSVDAAGTVRGSGAGVVVLRRFEDAVADGDSVYAVIRGSAVNNDGSDKIGFTAPSVTGQTEVIAEALEIAGCAPDTIGFVEGHGTATALGDPIEVAALEQAFGMASGQRLLGSVKSNIGHLDAAAGIAGLVKAALAVREGTVPPTLCCGQSIKLGSGFEVNTEARPWPVDGPRRAGVSSFGMGGTNVHVVVEQPPEPPATAAQAGPQLLVLSARSPEELRAATHRLTRHLEQNEQALADVAYTLHTGRARFAHRLAVVCDQDTAVDALSGIDVYTGEATDEPAVVFAFPGQGSQFAGMAAEIHRTEPVFRDVVDKCAEVLRPVLDADIRDVLFARDEDSASQLAETRLTQPAVFVVGYALAQLWMRRGVRPAAMIGHSIGELVAACVAGVFDLDDALRLAAARGRLAQHAPRGAMLAVGMAEQDLRELLPPGLAIAAVNGPQRCTVAGPVAEIDRFAESCAFSARRLATSHAFHSPAVAMVAPAFARLVAEVPRHAPTMPYISGVTGNWITAAEATDPGYWSRHLTDTVRFGPGLATLLGSADRPTVLLEMGPGSGLTRLATAQLAPGDVAIPVLPGGGDETTDLLRAVGRAWTAGVQVSWAPLSGRRVSLPGYPFSRSRHWLDAPAPHVRPVPANSVRMSSVRMSSGQVHQVAARDSLERHVLEVFQQQLGIASVSMHDDLFALGGDSITAMRLAGRLSAVIGIEVPVSAVLEHRRPVDLAAALRDRMAGELADLAELSDAEIDALVRQTEPTVEGGQPW